MRDVLTRLFRHNGHPKLAPAVVDAKKTQDAQFKEWSTVMAEIERAQEIARGGAPQPKAQGH